MGFVLRMYGPRLRDPQASPPENLKTVISGSLANLMPEEDADPRGSSGKMTPPVKCVSGF
ncbi:conserved hypothetical protein [Pseudomonas sp. IT-P176]